MLHDERFYLPEFMRREVRGVDQGDRVEPELGELPVAADVDMGRLIALVAVEEEAKRTDAKNGRQGDSRIHSICMGWDSALAASEGGHARAVPAQPNDMAFSGAAHAHPWDQA